MPIVRANVHPRFQRGGALADAGAMYIEREADDELVTALAQGDYCLVFAPRQVGKSSLRVRAAQRLRELGSETAYVDLSAVGAEAQVLDWYFSVTREIAVSLGLAAEVSSFWDGLGEHETPASSLRRFMSEVVLERIDAPVVVFIDEADVTLSLPFSRDDFFAAIRAMFNERAEDERWTRLSFCLIGVMTRADLVEDLERTPFNIECTEVLLRDLSREELEGFRPGFEPLERDGVDVDALLDAVHHWTAGHPALSQRLCWTLVDQHGDHSRGELDEDEGVAGREREAVDACVQSLFLERGRELDPVLNDTARRFNRSRRDRNLARDIELYGRLLGGAKVAATGRLLGPGGVALLARLRVAGLIGETEDGLLTVRSRIVAQVFNQAWARSVVDERLLSGDLHLWLDGGRNPNDLLRGARLTRALEWMEGRTDITDNERDFVFESEAYEAQRRRGVLVITVGFALSLAGLLVFAVVQFIAADRARTRAEALNKEAMASNRRAKQSARDAERAARNERGYRASLLAGVGGSELNALIVALEASEPLPDAVSLGPVEDLPWPATVLAPYYQTLTEAEREALARPSTAVAQGLVDALVHSRTLRELQGRRGEAPLIALSPDGALLATASYTGGFPTVYAMASGESLYQLSRLEGYGAELAGSGNASPSGGFTDLRFSPNGALIATVSRGVVELWSAETGAFLTEVDPDDAAANYKYPRGVEFSPVGDRLATNTGLVARTQDGEPLGRVVSRGASSARHLLWSPANDWLAVVDEATRLQLWTVGEQGPDRSRELGRVSHHDPNLSASPDGSRLAVIVDDRVQLWDPRDPGRKPEFELAGHQALIMAARFSPDGQILATTDGVGTLWLWDPNTGRALAEFESRAGFLEALAWDPEGQLIAAGGEDSVIRLWHASGADTEPVATLAGHRGVISQLEFTPDGETLVSTATDGRVRQWGMQPGLPRAQLIDAEVEVAAFLPDGQRMVTGEADALRVWTVEGGEFERELEDSAGVVYGVLDAAQSPAGPRIAALEGRMIGLWDADTGARLHTLEGRCDELFSAAFSEDGSALAAGCGDGKVEVWDVESGEPFVPKPPLDPEPSLLTLLQRADEDDTRPDELWSLLFTTDGSSPRIVGGGNSGALHLWEGDGRALMGLSGHSKASVVSIAKDPHRPQIAAFSTDGHVHIWNLGMGQPIRDIETGLSRPIEVCYADAGRRLVAASESDVVLWDANTGERLAGISKHRRQITALACAPDGKLVATASRDGVIELWDPVLSRSFAIFDGLEPVEYLRYSPTGEHILAITDEGRVSTWTVEPEAWIEHGCELLLGSTVELQGYAAQQCLGPEVVPMPLEGEVERADPLANDGPPTLDLAGNPAGNHSPSTAGVLAPAGNSINAAKPSSPPKHQDRYGLEPAPATELIYPDRQTR